MSYILDALKQNESSSKGTMPMQGDYQQEYVLSQKLRFYRNLALFLGFLLTLTLGFFLGKGLQTEKVEKTVQTQSEPDKTIENKPTLEPVNQLPIANQPQIQYQLVPVPMYSQPLPVQAQQAPQTQQTTPENGQTEPEEQQNNDNQEIDLSEYKVVGYQNKQREETNALIDAFSQAFEQAQNEPLEQEVITSSTTSARVPPIENLPEAFRVRIPEMRYQAHVFASEPSRSWIKINDRELKVGDNINGVYIIEIAAEQTLMQFEGVEFSLGSMEDWQF
ncbi:general secretion pathway protein GspB [Pseudoalteromonas sp.]|uniref:general secretion pathway protein GspB n=1 Tax=Pseudoalteromonas sp. TaxID=53249 RepID=UPI0035678C5A